MFEIHRNSTPCRPERSAVRRGVEGAVFCLCSSANLNQSFPSPGKRTLILRVFRSTAARPHAAGGRAAALWGHCGGVAARSSHGKNGNLLFEPFTVALGTLRFP